MKQQAALADIIAIAKRAGNAIMAVYAQDIEVRHKQDNSPLTQADLAAHDIIESGLAALIPELPVLSEESAAIPFTTRRQWDSYWLVDPLDGTREFIKRNGEFTVNIALIENHRPALGVVYAPALDLLFFATAGHGAFRQLGNKSPQAIRAREFDSTQVTVAGSRSHASEELLSFLDRMGPHMLISMGSSLKICLVAEGRADVYPRLGLTSEWDTAAAQCVLEEAGGRLIGLDGASFRYNLKESLLNPHFFAVGAGNHDWTQYL
ncbi:MAG TPA: 3'(2'),5'-bisphosphate nucleotidase CysQ [Novimethylophilus sp.]|jgi:3'(2'), 5'-bisphosphate nucleotidase|uniref:3'(2'),5'-bisphosphate nucleotidase CysQ n=1 Tax=Novimethylophilus sp. TaxID=2137426 RepID=UPI002F42E938